MIRTHYIHTHTYTYIHIHTYFSDCCCMYNVSGFLLAVFGQTLLKARFQNLKSRKNVKSMMQNVKYSRYSDIPIFGILFTCNQFAEGKYYWFVIIHNTRNENKYMWAPLPRHQTFLTFFYLLSQPLGNRRLRRLLLDSVFFVSNKISPCPCPEFSIFCPEFSKFSGHGCEEFGNRWPQLSTEVPDSKEASDSVDDLLVVNGLTVDDGFNSCSDDKDEDAGVE